jgi:hypothetical protein
MLKKLFTPLAIILLFVLIPPAFYFLDYSQSISFKKEEVVYVLPYPGILPDHPLYFVKTVRDRIIDWVTRDNIKKAEYYLLFSDKRVAMAESLARKGKDNLAISTYSKAEKYFQKIIGLLTEAKKQGASPNSEFINNLRLSNRKHYEVGQILLKILPQGSSEEINQVLKMNQEIKQQLVKF